MSGLDRVPNLDEKFEEIRMKCRRDGIFFKDPDFPASLKSIYHSRSSENHLPPHQFQWKRPQDICRQFYNSKPQFFVDGGSRFDLNQGEIGNCWVVAAAACLSENKRLLDRVVPPHQRFDDDWYAGVFFFRFWQFGRWVEVIVDDLLPTINGNLVFVKSNQPTEFWGALLEKAYAKLHGSYEALRGGTNAEALTDFTGGLVETYFLRQAPLSFQRILVKAFERKSLVAASIYFHGNNTFNAVLPSGLVVGHAYSVTAIKIVKRGQEFVHLLRVRNPWGTHVEWRGPWGDDSREWNSISFEERKELDLLRRADGEFWMALDDVLRNFDSIEICNLTADSLSEPVKTWTISITHGQWLKETAGGKFRYPTFWNNPQIRFKVADHDEDDDQMASFVVELLVRSQRTSTKELTVGFLLFEISPTARLPLRKNFYEFSKMVGSSDYDVDTGAVSKRFLLPPRHYVVIPYTWHPKEEAEFTLRIFSEAKHSTKHDPSAILEDNMVESGVMDESLLVLRKYFDSTAGMDKAADPNELKRMLDYALKYEVLEHLKFDYFTCKYLVMLMDTDFSNKLEFQEFAKLWFQLKLWLTQFVKYDQSRSGVISDTDLKTVISVLGYRLEPKIVNKILFGYSDEKNQITFNRFIHCSARLHMLFAQFRKGLFNAGSDASVVNKWLDSMLVL